MNNLKLSKVDEKLRAAEARRAELERAKSEEMQKKIAMRRDRAKKTAVSDENKMSVNEAVPIVKNVREFGYMKCANGRLYRLNWEQRKKDGRSVKLFTIKCVERLIERGELGLAEVVLGIMKRSMEARHPIQNKFAHMHGRIAEHKEKTKRALTYESGALNFMGSISPVRLPEFEADLDGLSRISSPEGMEELEKKYANIEELAQRHGKIVKSNYATVRVVQDESFENCVFNDSGTFDDFEVKTPVKSSLKSPVKSPMKSPVKSHFDTDLSNFPIVVSPMKRPHKTIEAETVYTPQRKSARRITEGEIVYDDESVSQILLTDANAAFISNPYITTKSAKRSDDVEEGDNKRVIGDDQ